MFETQAKLGDAVIDRYRLKTIRDLIDALPIGMCHVLQESKVFETYPPDMTSLLFDGLKGAEADARYRHYRDDIIPGISVREHLEKVLAGTPERKPCFCRQMADIAGLVTARMLGCKVYILRNIYVNYLYLPQRWHCINAIIENGRIRYFDTSAYAQVIDPDTRRIRRPSRLPGFDAADIDPTFIVSEHWLQEAPYPRRLQLVDGRLEDNFVPSPNEEVPADGVHEHRILSSFATVGAVAGGCGMSDVVVTGRGWQTALGHGLDPVWTALVGGATGIAPRESAAPLRNRDAAIVPNLADLSLS
ncbi:hypothetical protein [Breoghania sp.]|uniref:hypothetical protein n=1 Tax=Breoghania sp. TaxID=2065378 RepID=UPI00260B9188|nr:hypothetical protein [Breoghania sp.]MDJ0933518.1 hypothetical protein [Breoghania sp.]